MNNADEKESLSPSVSIELIHEQTTKNNNSLIHD